MLSKLYDKSVMPAERLLFLPFHTFPFWNYSSSLSTTSGKYLLSLDAKCYLDAKLSVYVTPSFYTNNPPILTRWVPNEC